MIFVLAPRRSMSQDRLKAAEITNYDAFHSLFARQDAHGNIVCQWQLQRDCEPR